MKPAAFKASYADWKLIKTRGVVQLVFEVPIEKANEAYECLGGMPFIATESWFAIARLKQQQEEPNNIATEKPAPTQPPARAPKKWDQLLAPQQAGILCETPAFDKFLNERGLYNAEVTCAEKVYQLCNIKSRSEILPGTAAWATWTALVRDYRAWMHEPEYV